MLGVEALIWNCQHSESGERLQRVVPASVKTRAFGISTFGISTFGFSMYIKVIDIEIIPEGDVNN